MKEKHLTGKDASAALRDVRKRLEKERRKAGKGLEARLNDLQARVVKEGQALRRSSEDAVQRALGALNVPSRQDISRLTRKVDELSRRIDRMRPGRRR
jgi:polyhydroxyalkanoate synthesis regulator phasin